MEEINHFLNSSKKPAAIRKFFLAERMKIPLESKQQSFEKLLNQFINLKEYRHAMNILAYYGKVSAGEFNTLPLLERILKDGKRLFLPKCISNGIGLDLFEIKNSIQDVEEGKFGIKEPRSDPARQIGIQDIDIAIIPGSVFDIFGTRYGYGKGYYDALLQKCECDKPLKVAFSLDFAVVSTQLPKHRRDVPLDVIISEKRLIRCEK
jgi:5-formyltetrahydrofolate cyclo-ligase